MVSGVGAMLLSGSVPSQWFALAGGSLIVYVLLIMRGNIATGKVSLDPR